MDKLKVNGEILVKEDSIKIGVSNTFQRIMTEEDWGPSIDGLEFNSLQPFAAEALELPFSEKEIFSSL